LDIEIIGSFKGPAAKHILVNCPKTEKSMVQEWILTLTG